MQKKLVSKAKSGTQEEVFAWKRAVSCSVGVNDDDNTLQ